MRALYLALVGAPLVVGAIAFGCTSSSSSSPPADDAGTSSSSGGSSGGSSSGGSSGGATNAGDAAPPVDSGGTQDAGAPDSGDAASPLPAGPSAALVLWLRADVGVTVTDGGVASWADHSGSGSNATQATAAAQPSLTPGSDGGLPMVTFDGTSSYLTLPAGYSDFTAGFSTFIVAQLDTETANHASRFLDLAPAYGSLSDAVLLVRWDATGDALFYQTYLGATPENDLVATGAITSGSTQLYEFIVGGGDAGAATTATLYTNGTSTLSGSVSVPNVLTRSSNLIGESNLGPSQDSMLGGRIGEMIIYTTALSDADRASVETYLTSRWGL